MTWKTGREGGCLEIGMGILMNEKAIRSFKKGDEHRLWS